jgi:hypothetical protein
MSGVRASQERGEGPGWSAFRPAPATSSPAPGPGGLLARILPGMVGRGHGLDTLCLYLAIARTALLDLVVALGLPTPHDRAHRRAGGRNPWRPEDIPAFIALWMAGWHAASLAERYGRSRGSIWSKARQLGLPRRERAALFHPVDPRAEFEATEPVQERAENLIVGVRTFDASPAAETSPGIARLRLPVLVASDDVASEAAAAARPEAVAVAPPAPPASPPVFQAPLPVVLAGPEARHPAKPAIVASVTAANIASFSSREPAPHATIASTSTLEPIAAANTASLSTLAPVGVVPVQGLAFDPPLPTLLRLSAVVSGFPAIIRKGLRQEINWKGNSAYDLEVALRSFAGQHYKVSAMEMGISVPVLLTRRGRTEVPRQPRDQFVNEYRQEWAEQQIDASGYKRVQCRAYKARGVEFYFWCHKTETRWFSKLAKSKAWFREGEAAASYGF